ncbi:carbohydrate ABC transporter permease [Robinsoniella peoriensis]|uniref:carbohydrate ABC transporter permease n=1 Tax=Robinsoniella peoriensis TaxID=180332 RepID=UPI000A6833AB|nr:carbohydrate ABC transporter permease [Robinsoniella peoriensis]
MKKGKTAIIMALLIIFSIICIYPLIYLLFYSLKTNEEIFFLNPFGLPTSPQFENYINAINAFNIVGFFKNSIIVSVVSIAGVMVLALPFAYAVTRMKWKFKNAASTYMTLGLFIPIQVIIIPLAILVRQMHMSNTYFALIVPYIAFNISFSSMILATSFRSIPKEMEESAFMDGATIYRTFFKIIMPLAKPAIATAITFIFLGVWNEYTVASVFISNNAVKTLPVGLASFTGEHSTDWGAMGACLVMASIPTIIIYTIFSEQVEKALTIGGAVKG